jgi:hypothetical protein
MFATTPPPYLLPLTFPLLSCLDYSIRWYNYCVTMWLQANIITFACYLPSYWIIVVTPKLTPMKLILVPYTLGDIFDAINHSSFLNNCCRPNYNKFNFGMHFSCTTYYSFFNSQQFVVFLNFFSSLSFCIVFLFFSQFFLIYGFIL